HSQPLRAQHIGEDITLLRSDNAFHLVLVNPGIGVSTPEVFGALQKKQNSAMAFGDSNQFPNLKTIIALRNDLQTPANKIAPMIATVLGKLDQAGAIMSRMSGSGATCFGMFENAKLAKEACKAINSAHPEWWCVATRTIVS
ncbi:MAG: 4-(cytidine 5'-diphospho)-2-C-methyl-D-erythritol kinase, partial [Pseudomonadota bacterium]